MRPSSPQPLSAVWRAIANECLRVATSNDSWGPTGTQMSEIAQLTYNAYVYPHPCYRDRF